MDNGLDVNFINCSKTYLKVNWAIKDDHNLIRMKLIITLRKLPFNFFLRNPALSDKETSFIFALDVCVICKILIQFQTYPLNLAKLEWAEK